MGIVDRKWIEEEYLPSLTGKVLYVGVAEYTKNYADLAVKADQFITIDSDPEKSIYGATDHYMGDFLSLKGEPFLFDHISLYGIFGYPHSLSNDIGIIRKTYMHAHNLLVRGGTLMIGPNWRYEKSKPIIPLNKWLDIVSWPPFYVYSILFWACLKNNFVWWGKKC